jgi:hypothetical protein
MSWIHYGRRILSGLVKGPNARGRTSVRPLFLFEADWRDRELNLKVEVEREKEKQKKGSTRSKSLLPFE